MDSAFFCVEEGKLSDEDQSGASSLFGQDDNTEH